MHSMQKALITVCYAACRPSNSEQVRTSPYAQPSPAACMASHAAVCWGQSVDCTR